MAEEIKINIDVDAKESEERVGKLTREVLNLEKALEDLKNEQKEGTDEFKALQKQLDETNKRLVTSKERVNDFQDSFRLQQGSGVERFRNSIGLIGEGLRNLDFGKVKTGIGGATQAFGGLGKAIIATGIGALVILVTQLIANFDKLKSAGGLVGKVFTFIGDTISTVLQGIQDLSDAIGLTDSKAAAAQERIDAKNKKLVEDRLAQVNKVKEAYDKQIAVAQAAGKDTQDLEKKSAEAQKQILKTNIAFLEGIAQQSTIFADLIEPVLEKQKKALADLEQEEKVSNARRTKEAVDAEKKRQEERLKAIQDAQKKEAPILVRGERDRLLQERNVALNEIQKLEDEKLITRLQAEQRREKVIQDSLAKIQKAEVANVKETLQLVNATIEEFPPITVGQIFPDPKVLQENFDKLADSGLLNLNKRLDALKALREADLLSEEEYQKKKEELSQAALQKTLDQASQVLDIASSLSQTQLDNQQANLEREREASDAAFEARKANVEATIQNEQEKQAALAQIAKEEEAARIGFDKKALELRKRQIKREAAFAVADVALATALGIAGVVKAASTSAPDPVTLGILIASGVAAILATIAKARSAIKDANAAAAQLGGGGVSTGGEIAAGAQAPAAAFSTQTFQPTSINQTQGINQTGAGQPGSGFIFNPVVSVSEINQVQNNVAVSEGEATFGPG